MMDFRIGETVSLLARTSPYLGFRLVIYFGITLAYIVTTGGGAGIGWLFGSGEEGKATTAFYGALTGFGLVSGVLYWLREYLLYTVKAGHIAVLVELIEGQPLPEGRGQVAHGAAVVKERFVESSVLFGVDQLIKGILRAFNATVMTFVSFIPIPAVQNVAKFVTAVINMSLTYVDEVILAHLIRTRSENAWAGAREALVLYAQNYKAMLKNALFLTVIVWVLTLVIFLVFLLPIGLIVNFFPGEAGFWGFAIAVVAALSVKAALIEPFAMTALMQVYFKVTAGQQPNPEWEGKLEKASGKFRELKDKAAAGFARKAGGATPAA